MKQAELRQAYDHLREIVASEPPLVPLTDPELAERLSRRMKREVSSRNVGEWRRKIGIPTSCMRPRDDGDHGDRMDALASAQQQQL